MAVGNVAAYSFILLSKAAIKIAERKNWLPASYYNKKAIDYLREGDIDRAAKSNQTALAKTPHSEKGLIIKDLILMRREAQESQLLKKIELLEKRILSIEEEMGRNRIQLRRMKKRYYASQVMALLLFVPVLLALIAYAVIGKEGGLFTAMLIVVSVLNIAGFVFLSKTVLEKKRTEIELGQSEFLATQLLLKKRLDEIADKLFLLRKELDLSVISK